jgi:hypothetical protein
MEEPSPTRLFAALAGAVLVIYGIAGFFFDSSFAGPDDVGDAAGLLAVNGWANAVHVLTGAVGLLLAGFTSRRYAIGICALYSLIALVAAVT